MSSNYASKKVNAKIIQGAGLNFNEINMNGGLNLFAN